MSLFDDPRSALPESRGDRPSRSRRERLGWIAVGVAVVVGLLFVLLPSPYVIQAPGPVYDTLGTAEHDGEEIPLIDVADAETFPTEGSLDLLTVSVHGRPGATPGWLDVIAAWFDPTRSAIPVEEVFPPGVTKEDRDAQNTAAMVNSQQDAIAAALVELGYEFPRDVTITGILEGGPAAGVLETGDVVDRVDGEAVRSIEELREAIARHGTETPAAVDVVRAGAPLTVEITPVDSGGVTVIGVGVQMHYEFPVDVRIRLDDVGGPSAGMMFALGIVDVLTPDPMTGGETIAGTGTIDSSGDVGAIGGIRQKLWGAERAGADWFLAPQANCGEVVGNVPDGLRVFAVTTLDEAREIVEAVGEGADTTAYPACEASAR